MTLPLNAVVNIDFNLPAAAAARQGFDLGLIIGSSAVISTGTRVVEYASLAEMETAGFSTSSPEYLAAAAYFAAESQPSKVAIGVQGSGETVVQAVTACRTANTEWYMVYVPAALNADHTAVAAYVQGLTDNPTQYILQSSDTAVRDNTSGNLFATLDAAGYTYTHGIYSSDAHIAARVMGYAMGATTDAANSAYTLGFKSLVGATVESLTSQQVSNIQGNNGNVFINRGNNYNWYEKGRNFGGQWFDSMIYRDKLRNEMQLAVSDLLFTSPKIPQTEGGMSLLKNEVAKSCQKLTQIGYIAAGIWRGASILGLSTGANLPLGYTVLSDAIADQSVSDKTNRIAPPIYVAINEAGANQSIFITVNINS